MAVRIAVALALIAAAIAQQRVCVPPVWEGLEINYDIQQDFRGFFNISYDSTNQRVRVFAAEEAGNRRGRFETIALFQSKTLYEIDHVANRCRKVPLNQPFEPDCLPSNATFATSATLGITLPVDVYRVQFGNGQDVVRGEVVVAHAGNVPVSSLTFSPRAGLDHSNFFDITLGIKNPIVFTPPSICNSATIPSTKLSEAASQRLIGTLRR